MLFRLEVVGGAAAKEYTLEKNLYKMQADWQDLEFVLLPYRDTVSCRDTVSRRIDEFGSPLSSTWPGIARAPPPRCEITGSLS